MHESKLKDISATIWREIGGNRLDQFIFVPTKGSAGGIILGWNDALLVGMLENVGTFIITIEFHSVRDNFTCRCTSVYGPNARSQKHAFWDELRSCGGDPMVPWVICGDSNAIFSLEDKPSETPNLEDLRNTNCFVHDLGLLDPSFVGRRFSWTNGQVDLIWVMLDRFLVNSAWLIAFRD